MAQLVVRDIEEEVERRLRERALRRGRSFEDEVRDILRLAAEEDVSGSLPPMAPEEAATSETGLGTRIARRFAGIGLTEDLEELAAPVKLRFDPCV
jgi:antitoxin FitA